MYKIIFLILFLLPVSLYSQTKLDIFFDIPSKSVYNNYVVYNYDNIINHGDIGFPYLPIYTHFNNLNIIDIVIDTIEYYSTDTNIIILPKQQEFTDIRTYMGFTNPNDSIYNLNIYPNKILYYNGRNMIINPIIYFPIERKVKFIKNIKLTIIEDSTFKYIRKISNVDIYDLLIITRNEFVNDFLRYTNYKQQQGYYVKIVSTEDIYTNYEGVDNQQKIRNCIKYYYNNHNTKYVILGGTSLPTIQNKNIIPHRGMWGYFIVPENDIPADIYFSNLDGEWINEGDTIYGKINSEDLTTEVYVGRLPIIDNKNLNDVINKLINYQDNPVVGNIKRISMIGEQLMTNIYGSREMEDLFNYGLPTNYQYYKIYDSLNKINVTTDNVLRIYNNVGVNLINHIGHSSFQNNMNISTGYYINRYGLQFIFNDGINYQYPIIYSQGCYSSALDLRDGNGVYHAKDPNELHCVAGSSVVSQNATVAFIGNTRYGFYGIGTWGTSHLYHREFINSLYNKNITKIGDVFYDSKKTFAPIISQPNSSTYIRWIYYTLNLYGDPTMDIWTDIPKHMNVSHIRNINIDEDSIMFYTDTPNATVACIYNGELISRGITNQNGNILINIPKNLIKPSNKIYVYVTAHNKYKYSSYIDVTTTNTYSIRGSIKYKNTQHTPLKNCIVSLYKNNILLYSTKSDIYGNYIFNNIEMGDYKIITTYDGVVGNINSIDALSVQKYFVKLIELDDLNIMAADVTNDGVVNTFDAYIIQNYFVGNIINENFNLNKWLFQEYYVTLNHDVVINIIGMCYGDVNGNYIPN